MKKFFIYLICIIFFFSLFLLPDPPVNNSGKIIIGEERIIQSSIFKEKIKLRISVPKGYVRSKKKYPVILTFGNYFHLVDGLRRSLISLAPTCIIVNYANFKESYFTLHSVKGKSYPGKPDLLISSLKKEILPYVEKNYRTIPYRVIFAHSWGGIWGIYATLSNPDIFHAAIASSPYFCEFDIKKILDIYKRVSIKKKYVENNIFFTEGNQPELVKDMKIFVKFLERSKIKGLDWTYDSMPEEGHNSIIPRTYVTGMKKLFQLWAYVPENYIKEGKKGKLKYLKLLEKKYRYPFKITYSALLKKPMQHVFNKEYLKAIELINKYLDFDSESIGLLYQLGILYINTKQPDLAKKTLKKALIIAERKKSRFSRFIRSRLSGLEKNKK